MKLETGIIVAKGACIAGGALFGGLVAGFSQWTGEGAFPSQFNCLVVIAGAVSSMFAALTGFLSSSFGNYMKARQNGSGDTAFLKKLDSGAGKSDNPPQT